MRFDGEFCQFRLDMTSIDIHSSGSWPPFAAFTNASYELHFMSSAALCKILHGFYSQIAVNFELLRVQWLQTHSPVPFGHTSAMPVSQCAYSCFGIDVRGSGFSTPQSTSSAAGCCPVLLLFTVCVCVGIVYARVWLRVRVSVCECV